MLRKLPPLPLLPLLLPKLKLTERNKKDLREKEHLSSKNKGCRKKLSASVSMKKPGSRHKERKRRRMPRAQKTEQHQTKPNA